MQLQPVRLVANFSPALLDALDAYRRTQRVIPSRAETIRQAVRVLTAHINEETAGEGPQARSKS
jgi:hypothetical protein